MAINKKYDYVVCVIDVGFKQYFATNDERLGIICWRREYHDKQN
jgi:hypothetical protein